MPSIKVLDTFGIPVHYYDLLKDQGTVSLYCDIPDSDEVTLKRAEGGDVLVMNKTPLTADRISKLDGVKLVSITASGYDIIDLDAARAAGITVCNAPGYSSASVAEQVFTLILGIARKVLACHAEVQKDKWLSEPLIGMELEGKTLGVVGFGQIGRATCRIATGFGMQVQVYTGNPKKYKDDYPQYTFTDLDNLLTVSDCVSLHIPHSAETDKIINREKLDLMKPGAVLINTARGRIIDEETLIEVLNEGRIFAGLDVLETEPIQAGHAIKDCANALVSPHVGWYTDEALGRLMGITKQNIAMFFAGSPQNVVS